MAKAMHRGAAASQKSFAKRMSDNIAWALITYTLLLIFLVTPTMETRGMSILPYFMLVVFVAIMVPFCRRIDRRWKVLDGSELSDSGLATRYAIDRTKLWIIAIGAPAALAFVFNAF
jgi:hypothetical protein